MIALVTGATGFVGSHLAERLVARGDEVRCVARKGSDRSFVEKGAEKVRWFDGDVAQVPPEALAGADVVFHVAGQTRRLKTTREDLFRVNEGGTAALADVTLRHAPGLKRFVLVSTISAVGPAAGGAVLDESVTPNPRSDYGASKLAGERAAAVRAGLPLTIVRPPSVYGPRDRNMINLFKLLRFRLRPSAGNVAGFVHVEDLVDALVLVADRADPAGEVYHAATENASVTALGKAAARAMGVRAAPLPLPAWLLRLALDAQKAVEFTASWPVSSEKLRRAGWAPRWDLERGTADLVRWYRARGML